MGTTGTTQDNHRQTSLPNLSEMEQSDAELTAFSIPTNLQRRYNNIQAMSLI